MILDKIAKIIPEQEVEAKETFWGNQDVENVDF
jgi:hypothetical protein